MIFSSITELELGAFRNCRFPNSLRAYEPIKGTMDVAFLPTALLDEDIVHTLLHIFLCHMLTKRLEQYDVP